MAGAGSEPSAPVVAIEPSGWTKMIRDPSGDQAGWGVCPPRGPTDRTTVRSDPSGRIVTRSLAPSNPAGEFGCANTRRSVVQLQSGLLVRSDAFVISRMAGCDAVTSTIA